MISNIMQYNNTLKVLTVPTNIKQADLFYTDVAGCGLLHQFDWRMRHCNNTDYVVREDDDAVSFHRAYFLNKNNVFAPVIDHINGVGYDCVISNLRNVSPEQNSRNRRYRGYKRVSGGFRIRLKSSGNVVFDKTVATEDRAALVTCLARNEFFSDCDYNFFLDRRDDPDILDKERTGEYSPEEGVFMHVMRYAKHNAWYLYRYNLFSFFKLYNVPEPKYSLSHDGYMIDPVTGELLCPYR